MTGAEAPPGSGGAERAWPEAHALADRLADVTGGSMVAVLLYGSHLLKANPDKHSAFDFVVIVRDYRPFLEGLSTAKQLHRPVGLMVALSKVLTPNVMAFAPEGETGGIAKYLLISQADLERALGPNPPDHFVLGRLVQKVGVVWTAGPDEEAWLKARLGGARGRVLDWMAPYLDGRFDADDLGRRILEVCYQGEFRPESTARAGKIYESQVEHFRTELAPGLSAAVQAGTLIEQDGGYVLAESVTAAEQRRWRRHFRRSKARTTARWFKHTITFVNWLPYIQRKVERHSGRRIRLTTLERKLPLIFLWPRLIHTLLTRPSAERSALPASESDP